MVNDRPRTATHPAVSKLRRDIRGILSFRRALFLTTVWALMCGIALLILRAGAGRQPGHAFLALAGFSWLSVIVYSLLTAHKATPSENTLRSFIDGKTDMGGMLMASAECAPGTWSDMMPPLPEFEVRFSSGRATAALLGAAAWALLCAMVPIAHTSDPGDPIDAGVTEQIQTVDLLEDLKILDSTEAARHIDALEGIREDLNKGDLEKALNSLDTLKEDLQKLGRQAVEEDAAAAEEAAALESMAGALKEEHLPTREKKRLAEALARSLPEDMSPGQQKDDTGHRGKTGEISREQLEKILHTSAARRKQALERIRKLEKSGLLRKISAAKTSARPDPSALAALLLKDPSADPAFLAGEVGLAGGSDEASGLPGSDSMALPTALRRRSPITADNSRGRPEALSPEEFLQLKQTILTGLRAVEPEINDENAPTGNVSASVNSNNPGGSIHRVILPRHRKVVKTYLEGKNR